MSNNDWDVLLWAPIVYAIVVVLNRAINLFQRWVHRVD